MDAVEDDVYDGSGGKSEILTTLPVSRDDLDWAGDVMRGCHGDDATFFCSFSCA